MKRSYQELAAENRRLRARVARLTVKLEATTDRLRAEVEARDALAACVSGFFQALETL